jgi:hypothetical protein
VKLWLNAQQIVLLKKRCVGHFSTNFYEMN